MWLSRKNTECVEYSAWKNGSKNWSEELRWNKGDWLNAVLVLGQRVTWGKRSWNHIPAETLRCSVWPPEEVHSEKSRRPSGPPQALLRRIRLSVWGASGKHFQVLEMMDVCHMGFHGEALPWVCTEGFTVGIKPYTTVGGSGKGRSRKRSWRIREGVTPLRNERTLAQGASQSLRGDRERSRVLL